jgi:hypothetical protein
VTSTVTFSISLHQFAALPAPNIAEYKSHTHRYMYVLKHAGYTNFINKLIDGTEVSIVLYWRPICGVLICYDTPIRQNNTCFTLWLRQCMRSDLFIWRNNEHIHMCINTDDVTICPHLYDLYLISGLAHKANDSLSWHCARRYGTGC